MSAPLLESVTTTDLGAPADESAPSLGGAGRSPASVASPSGHGPSGRLPRARWERPALAVLLLVTAALYLWDLSSSGWANSFYSAAVQAGSESWKAFLFGASDAAGSITVDKPPASLWIMALSVRAFGLSSWSILVPQALMGVGTVAIVHATVRRHFSGGAALLAGAVLALTPVAALMFRFNNPDALLVLLLAAAALATMRAIEDGRTRWMLLAGALVGFGFLTKQLQAFLVLPGFAAAYLVAAPVSLGRRIRDGVLAVGAMVLALGWWVALVELVPASMRPYVGGSQNNSFLELTFGYNGFGRLTGNETGSVGGGATAGGSWGTTGIGRLFSSDVGGQIAWLVPAALALLGVGLWLRGRLPRTDIRRAALVAWGSWLVVTAVTFSFMAGVFHAYYTVALAPAVAAVIGMGGSLLWERRAELWAAGVAAGITLVTAAWSFVLLSRSADWLPWLRYAVIGVGVVGAAALVAGTWYGAKVLRAGLILALASSLAGPTAYTVQTVATGHTGSIVTAGPAVASGPGGGMGGGFPGGGRAAAGGTTGTPPAGQPPRGGTAAGGAGGAGGPAIGAGGMGGLLSGSTPSAELTTLLLDDADSFTWVAATVGANNAAGYQLATEKSVMPIGGFNGSDPSPTLAQFKAYVASGQIHYFISGGGFGQSQGGSSSSSEITAWVAANVTAQTVGGTTVYDLSGVSSAASA